MPRKQAERRPSPTMLTFKQPLLSPAPHPTKAICLLLSLVVILSSCALVSLHFIKTGSHHPYTGNLYCHKAEDQASCVAHVAELLSNQTIDSHGDNRRLLAVLVEKSVIRTGKAIKMVEKATAEEVDIADCVALMEMSIDRMKDSIVSLHNLV